MKIKLYFPAVLMLFLLVSCTDESADKFDIVGSWLVTRTLISGSTDFPDGYQDQQVWTFTQNGDSVTLSTTAGSVAGVWQSSQTWGSPHWVFDTSWEDSATGMSYRVLVEIIGIDPLKGTNESYVLSPYSGAWELLDAFQIEGERT